MAETLQLPQAARRVIVAANPRAGAMSGKAQIERLRSLLEDGGFSTSVETDIEAIAEEAAESLRDGSLRAVVAAGGDGTAELIVNRTPPGTPVMLLPLGTENLLARNLEIPSDPDEVFAAIEGGAAVRLDAGSANGRIFLLMLGVGFDADVVRRLDAERSGHIHHLSYVRPIFSTIFNYKYPELRLTCETADGPQAISARWAFVVNLPQYAVGLSLAPDAVGDDGLLDVCTFKRGSLLDGLRYLVNVLRRRHREMDDCVLLRTARLRIESPADVPYQVDGDPGGQLPVDVKVLPGRLTLLVPPHRAPALAVPSEAAAPAPSTA